MKALCQYCKVIHILGKLLSENSDSHRVYSHRNRESHTFGKHSIVRHSQKSFQRKVPHNLAERGEGAYKHRPRHHALSVWA